MNFTKMNLQTHAEVNTNKVKFGLKNVHYATFNVVDGKVVFDTPKPIPGAVNLSLDIKGGKTEFHADDMAYFVTMANDGYEGDLEVALIPDSFRADVLKDEVDSNGILFENANAIPNNFALLYEFAGDKKATRHINYNVSTSRPSIESGTKEEDIEPITDVLEITASPNPEGYVKARVIEGQAPYEGFYDKVYEYEKVV